MSKVMNEQERLAALANYDPRLHLIKIKSKKTGEVKDYLPASYRFYELSLRYADANFSTEILLLDIEHNLCVVRCRLYLGPDFECSPKKVEACKSGLLSELDKVETGAQARCCRLFGIGTEYALNSDSEEEVEAEVSTLSAVKDTLRNQGLVRNPAQWQAWKREKLGQDVPDEELTGTQLLLLRGSLNGLKKVS